MKNHHLIHLYNRVGFGILPKEVQKLNKLSTEENVKLLFKKSKKRKSIKVDVSSIEKVGLSIEDKNERRKLQQKENRRLLNKLNVKWFDQLYTSETLLHDKMRLFWANHFVCSSNSTIQTIEYLSVIEKHALGNFKDFVVAISKNPMMIRYLNNQQNKKKHPNENYARELMELFTLGVGNYTEKDIKESARAFTGWFSSKNGFTFKSKFHDFESKTFLGKTGDFDGTDIINIILEQEQCSLFISEKIYKEFVNPKPNQKHIKKMAKVFRKNYEIADLMKFVLTADWFYDDENIGVKIKSPVELLVSIHNVIPYEFKRERYFQYLQFNLGQKLLYPPNVAGWPGDKQWIDANTIMLRLKLASSIAQQKQIELEPESAFEDDFETINKRKKNKAYFIFTTLDWQAFDYKTIGTKNKDWQDALLGTKLNKQTQEIINPLINNSTKDFCIAIMSIPEYQMC
ncbi:uncharacterized protein (DUF1800 family) [Wenyingzhuangia heitensis]|uniref:Uncharacterized protein (DUF1800 family) n=1 Tax=Wenyingzhuangia heitensis TaxID=1487859 RepID=A0ABX0U9Q5_9FLAO|nr:DUF1800 domain-containing protein [Wenyingzhuangia heitensis]NIJ44530.1 uncharacterized protein (DUF1800 family) [Wenyingzhuangia heitensis]